MTNSDKIAQTFVRLFEEIQHGDQEHRMWLREKIIDFAAGIGVGIDPKEMLIKEEEKKRELKPSNDIMCVYPHCQCGETCRCDL